MPRFYVFLKNKLTVLLFLFSLLTLIGTSRLTRLKLHVHGLINHGLHQRYLFGSLDHWSHGADFVCTILHKHLLSLKEIIPPEKWPHTLFIQVDNCWKENKNTTVFRYLGLLVKFGWFKNIFLHFLPTGHTHEDIDQMFSTWNIHYWRIGLSSHLSVPSFIEWAYPDLNTRPQFQMVQKCYNFKDWLKNFGTSMKGHSEFRAFKFILEKLQLNSNVSMFYKISSLRDEWKGISTENNGILLFTSFPDIDKNPPLTPLKELETEVIQSFMKHTSITDNLDTESLEFYLTLQTNSKFYLAEQTPEHLFSFGPFYTIDEEIIPTSEHWNKIITTDEIEQHFLRHNVMPSDVDSYAVVNIALNNSPFYIGHIIQILEKSVMVHPVVQRGQIDINGKWMELLTINTEVSKDKILEKDVKFNKDWILTKRWRNKLKKQFNLL